MIALMQLHRSITVIGLGFCPCYCSPFFRFGVESGLPSSGRRLLSFHDSHLREFRLMIQVVVWAGV